MTKRWFATVFGALFLLDVQPASAGSTRVSPTIIAVPASGAASTLRLQNAGDQDVTVQVRVYRWTQSGGIDHLTQTDSVVASPPIATLRSGHSQTVRIVRVTKSPLQGEESYRVLVDEIPDRKRTRRNAVTLAVRHSIPAFFGEASTRPDSLQWTIERAGDSLSCVVRNMGEQRVRVASLELRNTAGQTISRREGLVGYVLGHSSVRWPMCGDGKRLHSDNIDISALTENGPIRATGTVVARD